MPERARAATNQGLDGTPHHKREHTPLNPPGEPPPGEHLGVPGQGQALKRLGLVGKEDPRAPGVHGHVCLNGCQVAARSSPAKKPPPQVTGRGNRYRSLRGEVAEGPGNIGPAMPSTSGGLVPAEARFHLKCQPVDQDGAEEASEARRQLKWPHARCLLRPDVLEDPHEKVNRGAQRGQKYVVPFLRRVNRLAQEAGDKADSHVINLIGLVVDSWRTARGNQHRRRQLFPHRGGPVRKVSPSFRSEVVSEKHVGRRGQGRGGAPNVTSALPEDVVNFRRIVMPDALRVPDAAKRISTGKHLTADAILVRHCRPRGPWAALPRPQGGSARLALLPIPGGEPAE